MFLDPRQPLATCTAETCSACPVRQDIHCHFRGKDLLHFLSVGLPVFLIGGAGIVQVNGWLLLPWLVICLGYFGFVEIRVMCSHCPHYAEPGGTLKCWANYGSPKVWKYRPGPMTRWEKIVFFGGLVAIWGYPIIWLVAGQFWFLLVLFVLTSYGFFLTMQRGMCSQCMNFACPLNRVGQDTRDQFLSATRVSPQRGQVKQSEGISRSDFLLSYTELHPERNVVKSKDAFIRWGHYSSQRN